MKYTSKDKQTLVINKEKISKCRNKQGKGKLKLKETRECKQTLEINKKKIKKNSEKKTRKEKQIFKINYLKVKII